MVDPTAFIIIQPKRLQSVLHGLLHSHRISFPLPPMLLGEAIAAELDDRDTVALFVKGLSCNVVSSWVLKNDLVLLERIKVIVRHLEQLLLDSLSLATLGRDCFDHVLPFNIKQ